MTQVLEVCAQKNHCKWDSEVDYPLSSKIGGNSQNFKSTLQIFTLGLEKSFAFAACEPA